MTLTDEPATCLVMAKAPVEGEAKTRLGETVGMATAAELAAAALVDTVRACASTFPGRCRLALSGDLAHGVRADELVAAVEGWTVAPQRGSALGERLANAHAEVAGPVVQIGMDTPQATPDQLRSVVMGLEEFDAVLGPAHDGGWWVLALRDPRHATVLRSVPMSTPETYALTLAALQSAGLRVGEGELLRDVDEESDADIVADAAPDTEFARAWRAYREDGSQPC